MSDRWSQSNEISHSACEMITNLSWDDERFRQAKLGRDKAKRVLFASVGHERLPKPGYETYLGWCNKTVSWSMLPKKVAFYLVNSAGKFYVKDSHQ